MVHRVVIALEYLLIGRLIAVRPDSYDVSAATRLSHADAVGVRPSGALSSKVNSSTPWFTGKRRFGTHAALQVQTLKEESVASENMSSSRLQSDRLDTAKVESLLEKYHGDHSNPAGGKQSPTQHSAAAATPNSAPAAKNSAAGKQGLGSVPSVTKFSDSIGYLHVLIFYGLLYSVAFILWLCFRYQQAFKVNVSRVMRQIAMFYWRNPRLTPIGASCVLYFLADIFGEVAGRQADQGGACWKIALILAAALYNGLWHSWFYRTLDTIFADGEDGIRHGIKRVILMSLAHLVLYLPVGVPFFLAVSDFFRRTFYDAESNCISSSVVAIPTNLGLSTTVAANLVATSYGWSAVFWQLSNVLNFTVVQMWSPPFKSTWDGIIVVLWNLYILAFPGEPVGVGPLLADRDVLTQEPAKQAASTNCDHTSLYAVFLGIYGIVYYALYILWRLTYHIGEYTYYFLCWLLYEKRNGQHWTARKTWELWCVLCYLVRITYMLAWLVLSWGCTIAWRIVMFPLVIFDRLKWYMGMFFVPRFWDYDACPCPGYEFDASWTWTAIIWDGSLLSAKR